MANRREFLQMGIAASALPVSTGLMLPNKSSTAENISPSIPIYKMIFDNRYAVARVFAKDTENAGGKTYGIDGDITSLWYHDLHHRWKKGDLIVVDHFLWHQHFNDDPVNQCRLVRIHMFDSLLETMRTLMDPMVLFEEAEDTLVSMQELSQIQWPEDRRPGE